MFKYIASVLSDGEAPSFGRHAAAVSLIAVIVWGTHVVKVTNTMPDLIGGMLFVTSCFALSKGMDIAPGIVQAISQFKKGG